MATEPRRGQLRSHVEGGYGAARGPFTAPVGKLIGSFSVFLLLALLSHLSKVQSLSAQGQLGLMSTFKVLQQTQLTGTRHGFGAPLDP